MHPWAIVVYNVEPTLDQRGNAIWDIATVQKKQSGHNPSEETRTGCHITSNYGRTPPNKHGGVGRQQQQQEWYEKEIQPYRQISSHFHTIPVYCFSYDMINSYQIFNSLQVLMSFRESQRIHLIIYICALFNSLTQHHL